MRTRLTIAAAVVAIIAVAAWIWPAARPSSGGAPTTGVEATDSGIRPVSRKWIPTVAGAPCRVEGRVRGAPAATVRLHVQQAAVDLDLPLTDDGRRFGGDVPAQGELMVVAVSDDGQSDAAWVTCDGRGTVHVTLELPTGTRDSALEGRCVYLETGVGVAGALVEGRYDLGPRAESTIGFSAVADDDGRFTLSPPYGTYRIRCIKDGDAGERAGVRVTGDAPALAEIYVDAKAALAGSVRDSDGNPMAGVWVNAVAARGPFPRRRSQVLTDTEGRFVLRGLESGPTTVEVQYEGSFASELGLARVELPYPEVHLVLRESLRRIEGRVVGPDQHPAEGATVRCRIIDRILGRARAVTRVALTDPDGRFSLGGLVPGQYAVRAEAEGYAPAELSVAVADGPTQVQLALGRACSAAVRIVPSAPALPVVVSDRAKRGGWKTVAGQTSEALIFEDVSGQATLVAEVRGDTVRTATLAVDWCSAPEHVIRLDDRAGRAQLTVEVVDSTGSAVPDVGILLAGPKLERGGRSGRSDARGRVTFEGLPAGNYEVRLADRPREDVTLGEGERRTIRLSVDRRHGDIGGVVVDGSGATVEGARVLAECGDDGDRSLRRRAQVVARSGPDGGFRFQPKDGGVCVVRAEHDRGRSLPVTLTAGSETQLQLRSSTRLSGRAFAVDARQVAPYTLTVTPLGVDSALERRSVYVDSPDGAFTVEDAPSGSVSLTVTGPAGRGYVEVEVQPGGRRDGIEVPVFQRGKVSGLVTGEDGTPIAGASVILLSAGRRRGRTGTGPDGRFELSAEAGAPVQVLVSAEGFYPTGTSPQPLAPGSVTDLGRIRLSVRGGPDEKSGGIGVMFGGDPEGIRIIRFVDDSPARDAGLDIGDVIVGIDGVPFGRVPLMNWVVGLRGPPGTAVALDVKRGGRPDSYTVIRRVIGLPEVPKEH